MFSEQGLREGGMDLLSGTNLEEERDEDSDAIMEDNLEEGESQFHWHHYC